MDLIHYADRRVLVVCKPRGVATPDVPALVRSALGDATAAARPVHRLDQAVGGLLVLARSAEADRRLSRQVQEGCFEKQYLAVVRGVPGSPRGKMEDSLLRDRARRVTRVVPPGTPEAKAAALEYAMLAARYGLSLLRIRLFTGRTHQIRVQLSSRGLPLVGDRKYGAPDEAEHIALWSHFIAFDHPETGERLRFTLPPPEEEWPWKQFN